MIIAVKDLVMAARAGRVRIISAARRPRSGVEQPGFADLVELVKAGKAYVKISGAYPRLRTGPDYATASRCEGADRSQCDRIVWGTDWPHPDSVTPAGPADQRVTPLFQIDDGGC
jgi:predicted TIM-barrel fold metal-dependent hydrolase